MNVEQKLYQTTELKSYAVDSAGVGYDKNVDAIDDCLRTQCTRTINIPSVPRRAMAQIIWGRVCPSGFDNMIRFNDNDIDVAKKTLIASLEKV